MSKDLILTGLMLYFEKTVRSLRAACVEKETSILPKGFEVSKDWFDDNFVIPPKVLKLSCTRCCFDDTLPVLEKNALLVELLSRFGLGRGCDT
jgi:hypothetical protein